MIKHGLILLGLLLSLSGYSQSIKSYVISSTGASLMGEDGALYLSIGEPMNTEISGGDIMISQGFLNVTIANSVSTDEVLAERILAYPNPTTTAVTIDLKEFSGDYHYELFDPTGQVIDKRQIQDPLVNINMESYPEGIFYLRVTKGESSSKTLKIVKQ